MDICMLTKLLPWPLGWLTQVVLGLVGDSERADTFTAVGIPQCVVWSGRVAGIVLLPPCFFFFCPPLCPQNRKKTALVYLSWRRKEWHEKAAYLIRPNKQECISFIGFESQNGSDKLSLPFTTLNCVEVWNCTVAAYQQWPRLPPLYLSWGQRRWGKNFKEEVKHFLCNFWKGSWPK